MNSDTPSSATPTQDGPDGLVRGVPQPRRGWSPGQTLAALGVAAMIAAFGGAAIYAATGGSSSAMGSGVHGGPGAGRWGGPRNTGDPGRGPDGGRAPAAPLHGEFVVAGENGGYVTELVQTGVLTAVSDSSITAKSADGFTQTYVLGSHATNTPLAPSATVTVHATLVDGTATASMVGDAADPGPDGPQSTSPAR
jgi:hypothetical protein